MPRVRRAEPPSPRDKSPARAARGGTRSAAHVGVRSATATRRAAQKAPGPAEPEATRDQILAHAARLFRHQGYAATTLRQTADAAGIKAGSLSYHSASKDETLGHVLDAGIAAVTSAVQTRIAALPANASYRDKIAAAI